MSHRKSRGFTLIELLVVIAIIAILAAILFPVFAQAREKARTISCLSNTRQMSLAQLQYAQDYDEMIVPWYQRAYSAPGVSLPFYQRAWTGLLQPYLKSGLNTSIAASDGSGLGPKLTSADAIGVFKCPSWSSSKHGQGMDKADCDGNGTAGSASSGWMPPVFNLADYGIAFFTSNQSDTTAGTSPSNAYYGFPGASPDSPLALAAIQRPAETANIGDGFTGALAQGGYGITFGCETYNRHSDSGSNFCFLDGHSKFIKGNIERYRIPDANGKYYEQYLTYWEAG